MIGETDTDMYPGVLWLEENHIQKADYWQKLSGNSCNSILNKLQSLEEKVPKKLKIYTECLKKFCVVKEKCMGQLLHDNYKEAIDDFKKSFE